MNDPQVKPTATCSRPLVAIALALLAACGGGGTSTNSPDGSAGDDDGGRGDVGLSTLSGLVLAPSGMPLANVTVRADGELALSNSSGQYVLTSTGNFPTENLHIIFDGSTAGLPGQYPEVGIDVNLPQNQASTTVPQVITLPDLFDPSSSNQTVTTGADGSTDTGIQVIGTEADMVLAGAAGTIISVGGEAGAEVVDINMTSVDPGQVPMLLPENLLGGGFVTIQPGNSTFAQPGTGLGLDALLPNDQNLPVGSAMDIWSFDHDESAWVNRSAETGQQGVVIDLGGGQSAVQANGVITEGGWHSAVQDVDPDCATTFTVRAVDSSTGLGVPGVVVQITTTGQVAVTDNDGRVTIPMVWAYDVGLLANEGLCVTTDLSYFLFFPIEAGFKTSGELTIPAAEVVAGGITDAGDFECDVPSVGTLSGIVLGVGATANEPVRVTSANGPVANVVPSPGGTFFVTDLEAGDYVASFECVGDEGQIEVPFTIQIGQVTSIVLQCVTGTGNGDVTVVVTRDGDIGNGIAGIPLPGATITLQGTDSGSLLGLVMIADAQGRATFQDVSGPFNVTAQDDALFLESEARLGHSLIGVSPVDGTIGVVIDRPDVFFFFPDGITFVTGQVLNPPSLGPDEGLFVQTLGTDIDGQPFRTMEPIEDGVNFTSIIPVDTPMEFALVVANTSTSIPVPIRSRFFFDEGSFPAVFNNSTTLDWGAANPVEWDQTVTVTLANLDEDTDLDELEASMSFRSVAEQAVFRIALTSISGTEFIVNLPDVNDSALADLDLSLTVGADPIQFFFETEQVCSVDLESNQASRTLTFPSDVTWIQPTLLDSFTLTEFQNLLVTWAPGDPAGPDGFGMELVRFFSSVDQAGDPLLTFWTISSVAGTTGFPLPPRALPMVSSGQSVFGSALTSRFDAQGFDFNSLHNQAAGTNLEELYDSSDQRCQAGELIIFTVF